MTDMSWMPWVVRRNGPFLFLYMKVWPFVRTIIRAFQGGLVLNQNQIIRRTV